jgi:hypothetical protein
MIKRCSTLCQRGGQTVLFFKLVVDGAYFDMYVYGCASSCFLVARSISVSVCLSAYSANAQTKNNHTKISLYSEMPQDLRLCTVAGRNYGEGLYKYSLIFKITATPWPHYMFKKGKKIKMNYSASFKNQLKFSIQTQNCV